MTGGWRDALKNHPFAVDAFFDFSLVLTYALPPAVLTPLLPPALSLDTFEDASGAHHAFVAIALVQTRRLRPAALPSFFGRDFFLVGTRLFVRFQKRDGGRLRGLYIVRSQTDNPAMRLLGDVFTRYRYETLAIDVRRAENALTVDAGAFHVEVDVGAGHNGGADESAPLPPGSPFATWKEARRFAGPMPYTFSALPGDEMLVVEGVRQQWHPRPVVVRAAHVPFFAERGLPAPTLGSAFLIEGVPYHWKPGRREPCPSTPPATSADPSAASPTSSASTPPSTSPRSS